MILHITTPPGVDAYIAFTEDMKLDSTLSRMFIDFAKKPQIFNTTLDKKLKR